MSVKEIKKDGKTFYRIQVSRIDRNNKRHQRKRIAKTISQAYTLERDLNQELDEIISGKRNVLWTDLISEYYDYIRRTKAPSTQDRERYSLEAHINPVLNSKFVHQIYSQDIDSLLFGFLSEKSKHTQKTVLRYISSVFNFAIDRGYATDNPCRGKTKLIKIEEVVKPILDKEQIAFLLHHAEIRGVEWYYHWSLAVYSGLRNGELYALRYRHIDLKKGIITVCESWNNKAGFHHTKNREVRFVPINKQLRELILELRDKFKPESEDAFVLPRLAPWEKGNQARELRLFCRGLGLPPINFHSLRAVYITQLLLNNIPIPTVMSLVSHKQLATTMRYIRLTGREILNSADCLDFSWNGNNGYPSNGIG